MHSKGSPEVSALKEHIKTSDSYSSLAARVKSVLHQCHGNSVIISKCCVCFVYTITDAQILASGSVQIPRFTLLESGGLQVEPVLPQDTGNYTCYATNSEGAIHSSATLTVWSKLYSVFSIPQRTNSHVTGLSQ